MVLLVVLMLVLVWELVSVLVSVLVWELVSVLVWELAELVLELAELVWELVLELAWELVWELEWELVLEQVLARWWVQASVDTHSGIQGRRIRRCLYRKTALRECKCEFSAYRSVWFPSLHVATMSSRCSSPLG